MKKQEKKEMESSSNRLEKLRKEGYTKDFMVKEGFLTYGDSAIGYKPDAVKIVSYYRYEGISDPADNSIVYAIETYDGVKGILTDAYGMYADEATGKFLKEVEEINKKEAIKNPENEVLSRPKEEEKKGSAKTDD